MGKFTSWLKVNKPESVNELTLGAATDMGTKRLGTVSSGKFRGTTNVSNVMEPYIREILEKQGVTPENAQRTLPRLIQSLKMAVKKIAEENGVEETEI